MKFKIIEQLDYGIWIKQDNSTLHSETAMEVITAARAR
uniref:Uncharacterized protein n=1 Tax=Rhizophora mucronata TaxID=61149 RepID=A0A2P2PKG7_RHIMU